MRIHRILIALIAFALMGLAPMVMASSATAARADSYEPATSTSTTSRALPTRAMHDKVVQPSPHKLIFKGRVDPGHCPVVIQKKDCKTCDWHKFKVVKTNDQSRWKVQIYAPRHGYWFWRGFVKAYGGYAKSYTGVWRTYTI